MLIAQGLGAYTNPLLTTTAYKPGGTAPTAVMPESTKPVGFTRWGIDQLKSRMAQAWEARIRDKQQTLLALYGAQLRTAEDTFGADAAQKFCARTAREGFISVLYPIGIIVELGVPFTVTDLAKGVLERTYTPTPEQRTEADFMIYAGSQKNLARRFGQTMKWNPPGLYKDLVDPNGGIQWIVNQQDASVNDLIAEKAPGFATKKRWQTRVDGFGFNPIQPTDAEFTQKGGLRSWYARGGFLLDTMLVQGLYSSMTTEVSYGDGYVLCNGVVTMHTTVARGQGIGWDVYLTISPDGVYKLRVTPNDAPWWADAANYVKSIYDKLLSMLCELKALGGDALIGAIPPTGPEVLAAKLANEMVSKGCKVMTGVSPFVPPAAEEDVAGDTVGLKPWQVIAIGLAGVGLGVLVAKRA